MSPLKKFMVIGFSFGAGFALVLAAVVASVMWYKSRPKAPMPWDTRSMRASLFSATLEGTGKDKSPLFLYKIENMTAYDYEINSADQIQLFFKARHSFSEFLPGALSIDLPLFIPAKRAVTLGLHLNLVEVESEVQLSEATIESNVFLRDKKRIWNRFEGFVILDKNHRYQIDLPKGW